MLKFIKKLLKTFKPILHPIINRYQVYNRRNLVRRLVHSLIQSEEPVRVVLGSGGIPAEGWITTDIDILNVLNKSDWERLFPLHSIDRIVAEHVFEHLTEAQFLQFLANMRPFLTEASRIRIAVPDGFHPDPEYIDSVRPGGTGIGADDHKVLYTYQSLGSLFKQSGFNIQPIEYFDENGDFYQEKWLADEGHIRRSADHDPRNLEKPLSYTSLIMDAWPNLESLGL